jgi:hypothetical protein
MASSGKRKTTMAKLNREGKLRDKRAAKAARKDVRKQAAAEGIAWTRDVAPGEGPAIS